MTQIGKNGGSHSNTNRVNHVALHLYCARKCTKCFYLIIRQPMFLNNKQEILSLLIISYFKTHHKKSFFCELFLCFPYGFDFFLNFHICTLFYVLMFNLSTMTSVSKLMVLFFTKQAILKVLLKTLEAVIFKQIAIYFDQRFKAQTSNETKWLKIEPVPVPAFKMQRQFVCIKCTTQGP